MAQTAAESGRSAGAIHHLTFFGGLVRRVLGLVAANLARAILPFWAASVAAFGLVAAVFRAQLRSASELPEVVRTLSPETVFATYVVLGLIAGTLPAIAFAIHRSVVQVGPVLDEAAGRILAAAMPDVAAAPATPSAEAAEAQILERLEAIRRRAGGVLRFLSPARAMTSWLTRRLERELHLELVGELAVALEAGAAADGSLSPAMSRLRTRVVEAAGTELQRRAWWGRLLAATLWAVILSVSLLPILVVRWWVPR